MDVCLGTSGGSKWLIRSGRRICHLASSWIRERGENVKWKEGAGKKTKEKQECNCASSRDWDSPCLPLNEEEEKQRLVRRASPDASKITRWTACSAAPPKGSSPFPISHLCVAICERACALCVRSSGVCPTRHCPPFVFARGPGVLPSYIPPPATCH